MAFFKTLKTSFNNVFVDGVFYKFKKVKLTRNRSNWTLSDLKTPISISCIISASGYRSLVMVGPNSGGIQNLKKIYSFMNTSKWVQMTDLPEYFCDYDDPESNRGFLFDHGGDIYFLSASTSGGSSHTYSLYVYLLNGQWQKLKTINTNAIYRVGVVYKGEFIFFYRLSNGVSLYKFDAIGNTEPMSGSINKDLLYGGGYVTPTGTAIVHKGILHFIGYSGSEHVIYDCQFLEGFGGRITYIPVAVRTGSGWKEEDFPKGSFEDREGVMHIYTKDTLYTYNDNTGTWSKIETNYINDSYEHDSIAYSWIDHKTYRIVMSRMYHMDNTYMIDFED